MQAVHDPARCAEIFRPSTVIGARLTLLLLRAIVQVDGKYTFERMSAELTTLKAKNGCDDPKCVGINMCLVANNSAFNDWTDKHGKQGLINLHNEMASALEEYDDGQGEWLDIVYGDSQ